jgi:hypothetical protein
MLVAPFTGKKNCKRRKMARLIIGEREKEREKPGHDATPQQHSLCSVPPEMM